MSTAASNYSITELEMCGLTINMASFADLLKKVDFDAIVDHLAITHIMKSKAEPTTTNIKRLLEALSCYSFNLYYIKGKNMPLSDFLSRQKTDTFSPHEIIPISFNLRQVLHENYYGLKEVTEATNTRMDKFLVQTRSQVRSSGVKLPEVHALEKGLVPHLKPEHQKLTVPATCLPPCHSRPTNQTHSKDQGLPTNDVPPIPKPRIGQGRAGIRRQPRIALPINIPKPLQTPEAPIPTHAPRTQQPLTDSEVQSQARILPQQHRPAAPLVPIQQVPTSQKQPSETTISHRTSPPYHEPFVRPPPRPPDVPCARDNRKDLSDEDMDREVDFEENSSFQEVIILETYERPDKSYI